MRTISKNVSSHWFRLRHKETKEIADPKKDAVVLDFSKQLFSSRNPTKNGGTFDQWKKKIICEAYTAWKLYLTAERWIDLINPETSETSWPVMRAKILSWRNTKNKYDLGTGELVWFQNRLWVAQRQDFELDEVCLFIYDEDPENEYEWFGPLMSLFAEVMWDLNAVKTTLAFWRNGAKPWMVFIIDEDMDEEEQEEYAREIKECFSWTDNAWESIVAPGIKDVKEVNVSFKELELINYRSFTTDKIASALWVPKKLMFYETQFGSKAEFLPLKTQRFDTVITPDETRLESIMNSFVQINADELEVPELADRYIECDSQILEDWVEKNKELRDDFYAWKISYNEWRKETWLEEIDEERARCHWLDNKRVCAAQKFDDPSAWWTNANSTGNTDDNDEDDDE